MWPLPYCSGNCEALAPLPFCPLVAAEDQVSVVTKDRQNLWSRCRFSINGDPDRRQFLACTVALRFTSLHPSTTFVTKLRCACCVCFVLAEMPDGSAAHVVKLCHALEQAKLLIATKCADANFVSQVIVHTSMTTASLLFDRCTTTSTRGSTHTLNSCTHNPMSDLLAASEVSLSHVCALLILPNTSHNMQAMAASVPSKSAEECLH